MQVTGREKGRGKKAVQPRLLYRGSTISTLFDLLDGIQIPLIVLGAGRKVSGTKKLGGFFFRVRVCLFWTHLMKRGQFDLLN